MSNEAKKPEKLGKSYTSDFSDDDRIIITVTIRPVVLVETNKKALVVGVGADNDIQKILREDDNFRYVIKDSFLKWLDEIAGII